MKSGRFQLGDITVEPSTLALTHKDGRPAQLRHKSRAVLACLLETPNRTVSKDHLLQTVWSGLSVSDESLVQCIADIRRIVGKDARQVVETVPREGYRVNVSAAPGARPRPALLIPVALVAAALGTGWALWPRDTVPPDGSARGPDIAAAKASPPGTASTAAYLEVLQGRVSASRFSQDESLVAERHFRRAIALDPSFARAYAELGTLLAVRFENDWTVLGEADKDKALFYAQTAASLDPELWLAHYALGRLYSLFGDLDAAERHLETAMSLQPGKEDARAYFGILRNFQGKSDNAVAILQQAVASHPDPPYWYYLGLGNALFNTGRNAEAEAALDRCQALSQASPYCLRYLIGVYGAMGRMAEAQAAARSYEAMGFELSVASIMGLMSYHHPDARARLEAALRRAGVPD